ncbi:Uncharacterised protein [Mycobacteroides abscessus subsp. abscessus]|uniref:helix-turn-helix domain-containing protein n=1 Tax=Mycobacteroides abscessus TaxID=36809 RepID=UPI0009A8E884|nr:helix-turn-helix domain-containing protein [Mycobacteroides abscessus]SKM37418.1 Uncharacterised protein [Mycobacteroides abscessus subsp. abscessus]
MTERFQHAIPNASVRRDIALAVAAGVPVEQLAAEFGISVSTVHSYAAEFQGAQRVLAIIDDHTRGAIIAGCRGGSRRRWERQYGAEVVRQLLGEA